MKKSNMILALATAVTLTATTAFAVDDMQGKEKCKVTKNGVGMIKEHKADCKSTSHSCAGQNAAGDAESWIMVPEGQCAKINAGNFSDVSQDIKDKIDGAN